MKLVGLELLRVHLPLVSPWVSGAGSFDERDSLLVRVVVRGEGADGLPAESEGWGECPALPAPTYGPEYTAGALEVSEQYLVPALLSAQPQSSYEALRAMSATVGHGMAKTAFEIAVLDATLRLDGGTSCADYFAGALRDRAEGAPVRPRARVTAGVAVGLGTDAAQLLDVVGSYVASGYRRVKLKIRPEWDYVPLAAVRERWPDLALFADANGAYASLGVEGAALALSPLDELSVACLEQPLGDDDMLGHADLARGLATPLCLDEALTSPGAVAVALELGACSVVNVKAGRLGGYHEALRAYRLCVARGAHMWCGGMVETGIGRAANVAMSSLPGFDMPGDLSASGRFFGEDVAGPLQVSSTGEIAVPEGPGLGVGVSAQAIDRHCVWRRWCAA